MKLKIGDLSTGKELCLEKVVVLAIASLLEFGESIPELNGTTEENGEYGKASSTVRTFT